MSGIPLEIPVFASVPLYTERVTLDGVEYILGFDWNGRENRWYFSLSLVDGTPVTSGVKLVCNWPLLRKVHSSIRPPGNLTAIDFSPFGGESPGFDDFGIRVRLVYIPNA